jgi:hypothetical protein
MEQIQPLIDLLSAKYGWLAAVLSAMGTARVFAKPFSLALQSLLGRVFRFVHDTEEAEDDEFIAAMLRKPWYRAIVFVVDYLTSVKLPTELPPSGALGETRPTKS